MKKISLLVLSLVLFVYLNSIYAQNNEPLGAYKSEGKWHIFDYTGKLMFPPIELYQMGGYSEGRILAVKEIDGQKKWIYLDLKGNIVFSFVADGAKVYSDSMAMVRFCNSEKCDSVKYGYYDYFGNLVIKPDWYDATVFHNGLTWVMNFSERGFINKKGEFVLKVSDEMFGLPFVEGLSVVQNYKQVKFGFMNEKGEIQIPLVYDDALPFSDSLAAVYSNSRFQYINHKGDTVIRTKRQFARSFKNGYAFTGDPDEKFKPLWQVINRQGIIMTQETFRNVTDFNQGIAAVQKMNGKWIFIDPYGQNILEKEFDFLTPFNNGLAWASIRSENKMGFINPNGQWVVTLPKADAYVDLRVNQMVK